jgi:hypothetical protein
LPAPAGYWKFDVTGITAMAENQPVSMQAVFPNPCKAITCIPLTMAYSQTVQVDLLDIQGKLVKRIHNGTLPAGEQKLFFDASTLPAGVFMIQCSGPGVISRQRISVVH